MESELLFQKAEAARCKENLNEALSLYQETEERANREKNDLISAKALHMAGLIFYQKKEYREAKLAYEFAQRRFERLNRDDMVGAVLRDLGIMAYKQDNYNQAQNYLYKSIEFLEKSGNLGHLGISQVKLGKVLADINQVKNGEALILGGISNIQQSPERFFESTAFFDLAKIQKQQGKKEEAKNSILKSKQILDAISTPDQFQARRLEINKFNSNL